MKVSDFDFNLPDERIALRPAEPRGAARMLVVRPGGKIEDSRIKALASYLRPGDAVVFNNTKVIPARLVGRRGAATIEVTLHRRIEPTKWRAFARPAKRLREWDIIDFNGLKAEVEEKGEDGEVTLRFDCSPVDFAEGLARKGVMPLPPYIASKRAPDARDDRDYQTLFARREGAVAAPTAGLHFSDEIMKSITDAGAKTHFITLHVGAGTFLPVKCEDTADHKMHREWGEISATIAEALNETRARGGRIVAVGTTSLRLLESATTPGGQIYPFSDETGIFITPGYKFRAVDLLVTNFHLPKSTLFMLVSAFSGSAAMKAAYAHAIAERYRFYSYGDTCLLYPGQAKERGEARKSVK
ncbi:MAG: tRNA preQ1(34) S-adenosylmethionine ribosyltransferase-isomerase QueA [Proteobacteria bacterium]|nr:tRNA preQ1(34) S-adenosylmethionine ribosyltransferase-isomerase QueA [Pseudomonadota bacterium]